jgi:hypothetical protein
MADPGVGAWKVETICTLFPGSRIKEQDEKTKINLSEFKTGCIDSSSPHLLNSSTPQLL